MNLGPQNPREAGVVLTRDDPWVLLYIPALDRLVWIDLAHPSYTSFGLAPRPDPPG